MRKKKFQQEKINKILCYFKQKCPINHMALKKVNLIFQAKKKSSARCCALFKKKMKKLNLQNNSITSRLIYIFFLLFIYSK